MLTPTRASQTAMAIAVSALLISGCATQPDTVADDSTSDFGEDPAGLNDDPELADDSLEVLGKYEVVDDALVDDVPADHAAVWERFAELIPSDYRPEVTMFVAIDAEVSGGTDGALQVNGLYPDERYIALDATGYDTDEELDRTILHEYAHLLTLRDSQLDPDLDSIDDCPVYADPSCPLETSYLYSYLEEFWPDVQGPDFDSSGEAIDARYTADSFVTEYAAKNPDEDIAEVFAEWMLLSSVATGDQIVDQKLRFFDDYPELVAFRDQVAQVL